MNTFGSGESLPFDRVEFFIYYFLSSLSKFKLYFDSTQTFATEATFNLIRLMFALFFACQIYAHARQFTKSKQMQDVYAITNGLHIFKIQLATQVLSQLPYNNTEYHVIPTLPPCCNTTLSNVSYLTRYLVHILFFNITKASKR